MAAAEKPVEKIIDDAKFELSVEHTERLKRDLASGIYDGDTLGKRYGLGDNAGLRRYLMERRWIIVEAKELKALNDSDASAVERIKLKSQIAYEEVIPSLHAIAIDPKISPKERIEASKELRQVAVGNDGKIGNAVAGNQLSVVINMPDRVEKIVTTVVEPDSIAGPSDDASC